MNKIPVKKKAKYRSKKVEYDGYTFDSKAEAKYYAYLMQLKSKGSVESFEMQKTYELLPKFKHPKTGKAVRAINYKPDFVVKFADGHVEVIDVKGFETKDFKLKAKMFMHRYEVPLILIKYDYRKGIFYEG